MEPDSNQGRRRATLVLEDGAVFEGWSFAGAGEVAGEVVFTTSMVGYQETLTDPSYRGQILLFTYPLIGNYGVIPGDEESRGVQASAVLVREYTPYHSNWASELSLAALLEEHGVLGVEGMDTRALTRHIRDKGAMRGIISTAGSDVLALREKANAHPPMVGLDLASEGSQVSEPTLLPAFGEERCRVAALDYGVKGSIYQELRSRGASVLALPGSTPPAEVLAEKPDGLFLSNGPGDPAALQEARPTCGRCSERCRCSASASGTSCSAWPSAARRTRCRSGTTVPTTRCATSGRGGSRSPPRTTASPCARSRCPRASS